MGSFFLFGRQLRTDLFSLAVCLLPRRRKQRRFFLPSRNKHRECSTMCLLCLYLGSFCPNSLATPCLFSPPLHPPAPLGIGRNFCCSPFLLFQDRALSVDGRRRRDFTRDFAKRMSEGGSKSGGGGGGRPTAQFFRRRLWMDPFLRLLTFSNGFLGVARSFDEKR